MRLSVAKIFLPCLVLLDLVMMHIRLRLIIVMSLVFSFLMA
jgi:hypothetical protein